MLPEGCARLDAGNDVLNQSAAQSIVGVARSTAAQYAAATRADRPIAPRTTRDLERAVAIGSLAGKIASSLLSGRPPSAPPSAWTVACRRSERAREMGLISVPALVRDLREREMRTVEKLLGARDA